MTDLFIGVAIWVYVAAVLAYIAHVIREGRW